MTAPFTHSAAEPLPDPQAIKAFFDWFMEPGDVLEIRVPETRRGPGRLYGKVAGYFDNTEDAVPAVAKLTGRDAQGVYVTLNPVDPNRLASSWNKLTNSVDTMAGDADIVRRRRLVIDVDPERNPKKVSATDEEQRLAVERRDTARAVLTEEFGWPAPAAEMMTGNGAALVYHIDLPNDETSTDLIRNVLRALDALYSDHRVKIDTAPYNAARHVKIPGTIAAKGDHFVGHETLPDRPWRVATAAYPHNSGLVSRDQLEAVATHAPDDAQAHESNASSNGHKAPGGRAWTMQQILDLNELKAPRRPWHGGYKWPLDCCLTSEEHTTGACLFESANGTLGYKCQHDSCRGKGWSYLRKHGKIKLPAGAQTSAEEWGDILPLLPAALPPFPVHILPPALRNFCLGLSRALQVPVDLVALLVLACCAAAVARKVVIQLREGWREPLNVWVVVALKSGNRKSAAVRAVIAPIKQWLKEQNEQKAPEIAQETSRLKIRQEQLKRAEQDAAKDPDNKDLENRAIELAAEVGRIEVPRPQRLLAIDVTPEKLVGLLLDHDGRMAMFVPEGGIFDMMAGKYSNGVPNLDVYLAAYCGDDIIVDRQGRPSEVVEDPALTMGISPQPDVLGGLAGKPGFRGRGLLARFQYGLPPSPVGQRQSRPRPLSDDERGPYAATVRALLDLDAPQDATGRQQPAVLQLCEGAQAIFEDFVEALEPELSDDGRLGAIDDWGSKLAGALGRYAAVLHLAAYADHSDVLRQRVSEETMRGALSLAEYFEAHAMAAFGEMAANPTLEGARIILGWIERERKHAFSKRECWWGVHGRALFEMADDLDRPLQLLCDHHIIRPVPGEDDADDGKRRGRKASARFEVNPQIAVQNVHKVHNWRAPAGEDNSGRSGPSDGSGLDESETIEVWRV